jgi:hypothetical protein
MEGEAEERVIGDPSDGAVCAEATAWQESRKQPSFDVNRTGRKFC